MSEGNFFKNFVLSQCIVYWIHFQTIHTFIVYWIRFQSIHTFTYQKTLLYTLLLLFSKIVESLRCILKVVEPELMQLAFLGNTVPEHPISFNWSFLCVFEIQNFFSLKVIFYLCHGATEAYLEPCKTSVMELFCRNRLLLVNYFRKKASLQTFDSVSNMYLCYGKVVRVTTHNQGCMSTLCLIPTCVR